MDTNLKTSLWQQLGASIDLLAEVIDACPDELWTASLWKTPDIHPEFAQFWYVTYHTLFWLDLYRTGTEDGFLPPEPFTLIEQYRDGPLPDRVYTKDEMRKYLTECRQKWQRTIETLDNETAQRHCQFGWGECSYLELILYNMRHVQGHATQLSMLLGQTVGIGPDWVTQAKNS